MATSPTTTQPTLIRPPGALPAAELRELLAYRTLFGFLVWREVRVRYAQTLLGVAWVVLQPLLLAAIFALVFGLFLRVPSDGAPYALFALAGLVPWTYLAGAVNGAANSLIADANLLTKVYFPRLVIPAAPVVAGLLDLAVALAVALVAALVLGYGPGAEALLALPAALLVTVATALGAGALLAALNLRWRDVRLVLPFLVQVWFFSTPVIYPLTVVPERWHGLYALNPMAGAVEAFRAAVLGTEVWWPGLASGAAVAALLLLVGVGYFRRVERVFADIA